jgi:hypothetical protein
VGLVREVVGRLLVFCVVLLTFCLGPLLGLVRSELPDASVEGPLEGLEGSAVWGTLWDAAAAAEALGVAEAAEPDVAEPADAEAEAAAAGQVADAQHADEGGTKAPASSEAAEGTGTHGTATRTAQAVGKQGAAGARAKGRKCDDDPSPEIVETAENKWTVQRDLIQSYTRNFAKLDSLGWSKRHDGADGKADGMLIGGVRCNSDLHRAGIRSGDVVHAVNGRGVTSFVDAFFVYTKVRNDPVVRVEITRRGQRKMLVYRLVG